MMDTQERRSPREIELELEVANLKKEMTLDSKTGAINERGFTKEMTELARLIENGKVENVSLIFVDVNDFKKFNDNYSHDFGDEALKTVATAMQDAGRDTDTVFRLGSHSDEFILLLPGANDLVAKRVEEKIKSNLQSYPATLGELNKKVAITSGFASYPEVPLIQLMTVAEKLMQQEKIKNRIGR